MNRYIIYTTSRMCDTSLKFKHQHREEGEHTTLNNEDRIEQGISPHRARNQMRQSDKT